MEIGPIKAKPAAVSRDFALIKVAFNPLDAPVILISPKAPTAPITPLKLKVPVLVRLRFLEFEELRPPTKPMEPEPASEKGLKYN